MLRQSGALNGVVILQISNCGRVALAKVFHRYRLFRQESLRVNPTFAKNLSQNGTIRYREAARIEEK
jgi:hypothetical protein